MLRILTAKKVKRVHERSGKVIHNAGGLVKGNVCVRRCQ